MTWNSYVFPNTGLAIGTFAVAEALDDNRTIQIIGAIMLVALVAMWLFVICMMFRAIYLKQILWPQKEDIESEPRAKGIQKKLKDAWTIKGKGKGTGKARAMNGSETNKGRLD